MADNIDFMLEELNKELKQFIADSKDNAIGNRRWIDTKLAKIYIRKGVHYIDGDARICLDIASVEVSKKFRKNGYFNKILESFNRINPWEYTLIENVMEQWFADSIKNKGYSELKEYGCERLPVTLYKKK